MRGEALVLMTDETENDDQKPILTPEITGNRIDIAVLRFDDQWRATGARTLAWGDGPAEALETIAERLREENQLG